MLVATTSPSLAPSRRESCLPDRVPVSASMSSPPRPGRMHSALVEDLRDAREGLTGCLGDVAPAVCSRPAHPVVERLGARPARLRYNDPASQPDRLAAHLNHLEYGRRTAPRSEERGYGRAPVWHEPEADERKPAGFQELAT